MDKKFTLVISILLLILISCSGDKEQELSENLDKEVVLYYNHPEEMPSPIGGMTEIIRKVVYPKVARRAGLQGTVYIKTFVNTKGVVTKTEILKGIGSGCDEAAAKAVYNTKFTPGRMYGEPVNVQIIVPVKFELM